MSGKVNVEIFRAGDGCRWYWSVWVGDEFRKNGVEDKIEDAIDAVLEWLESEVRDD